MLKSLLFSVVLMSCLMCGALPAGAEGETRTEASPAAEELYRGIMQRLDAMEGRLETQSQMKAHIDEAMQRLDEKTDRQLSFITAGFDALALMAALLGFAGFVIAVVTGKMYWQNIRRYQEDLKRLLAEARRYHKSMREMLASHSPSEKFAAPVLKQAEEAAASGVGSEVLWGKAVLAQQEERWKDALVYWQGVLELFPKDENALFGASLAALEMGEKAEGEERLRLWRDAEAYFQAFPKNRRTAAVWSNWGILCLERGKVSGDDQERERWYRDAEEKFRRAMEIDPHHVAAWSNLGNLCVERGKAASDGAERERWYREAEEKFRRATEINPHHVAAWSNWGTLCVDLAKSASIDQDRAWRYREAEEIYRRATEADPREALAWYNWGNLCLAQGKAASDDQDQERWYREAEEKYRRATEVDPSHVAAWSNWGSLCVERGRTASDGAERTRWYREAEEKFCRATEIDYLHAVSWSNWGVSCAKVGQSSKEGQDQERWYREAEEKYRRATEADPREASGWFNWACLASLRHDVKTCVECLERWRFCNPEASAADLDRDEDFDAVRQEPEFLALRARLEK